MHPADPSYISKGDFASETSRSQIIPFKCPARDRQHQLWAGLKGKAPKHLHAEEARVMGVAFHYLTLYAKTLLPVAVEAVLQIEP